MSFLEFSLVRSLWILSFFYLSYCGDRCPNKDELSPCTCSQVEVKRSVLPEIAYTTTPLPRTERKNERSSRDINHDNELDTPSSWAATENTNVSFYTTVSCKAPKTILTLEESVKNGLHRKYVDRLVLTNIPPQKEHTLVRLPPSWLKYIRIKQVEIRDTVLSGDFIHYGNPFEGQEQSMVSFTATNCYLSGSLTFDTSGTTNTKGLNLLPHLRVINFSRNHIVYLSNLGFRYPPANLTTINLSYNSIQAIEASTFHYAPKLKAVDLSHNLIELIARSFFLSPTKTLEEINFSWNNIKVVPADMFVNMPALKVVNLSHNFIYSLPEKPWNSVWRQLKFVELRGNFIECNCDLIWLLNILSPSKVNVTTTPAPTPLPGQTVLGSCDYTEPQMYTKTHQLIKLTRKSLNCA